MPPHTNVHGTASRYRGTTQIARSLLGTGLFAPDNGGTVPLLAACAETALRPSAVEAACLILSWQPSTIGPPLCKEGKKASSSRILPGFNFTPIIAAPVPSVNSFPAPFLERTFSYDRGSPSATWRNTRAAAPWSSGVDSAKTVMQYLGPVSPLTKPQYQK